MKKGSIEVSGRTIACLIRNQSETGAALEVVSPVGIPAQFTLLIAAERHQVHSDMADQEVDRRQIPSGIYQRKYHTKVRGTTQLDGPSATFSRYVDFALGIGRVWGRLRRGAQPNVGAVSAWTDIAWFGALVHDPRWGRFFSQTKSPATGRANRK